MAGFFRRLMAHLSIGAPKAGRAGQAGDLVDPSFRLLAEQSVDVICRVGPDRRIRYITPSCFRLFGQTQEEMLGQLPEGHVHPEDLPIIVAAAARGEAGETETDSLTYRIKRTDGTIHWVETNARVVRHPQSGGVVDVILVMRDVTDRKFLEDDLAALAHTDGLTGLANRRAFDEAVEQEWRRTRRLANQMSLLLLDLDHFKRFNDRYGHQAGDDCLRAVAAAVRGAIRRPGDIAARYGGEEIAVILPATDAQGALTVADGVRHAVAALQIPHPDNREGDAWVTASVGAATAVSRVGGTVRMPEALLVAADTALYKAKHNGPGSSTLCY